MQRKRDGVRPICGSELMDNVAHVIAHSTNADAEHRADLPVSLAMCRPVENIAFAWSGYPCGEGHFRDRTLVPSSEQNVSVHHVAFPFRGFGVTSIPMRLLKIPLDDCLLLCGACQQTTLLQDL